MSRSTPSASRQLISPSSTGGGNSSSSSSNNSAATAALPAVGSSSPDARRPLHIRTGTTTTALASVSGSPTHAAVSSPAARGGSNARRSLPPAESSPDTAAAATPPSVAAAARPARLSAVSTAGSSPLLPPPRSPILGVRTPTVTAAQRRADAAAAAAVSASPATASPSLRSVQASSRRSGSTASSRRLAPASNNHVAAATSSPATAAARSPVMLPKRARKTSHISSEDGDDDAGAESAAAATATPAAAAGAYSSSHSPRHHSSSHHTRGNAGALLMRQSHPSIQPPLVDPSLTPLIVLANLGGSALAALDVGHKHVRARVDLPGLASVVPNKRGSVVTASAAGWALWNPSAHLSEDEKLSKRMEAAMESPTAAGSHGAGGKNGLAGSVLSKNKYDEEGRLVEDAFDAARVFALLHSASKNLAPVGAAAATTTSVATPAAATAAAPSSAAHVAALAPPSLPSTAANAAPAMLTSATFLPDGRLLTSDRAGMLRVYADEAHRFRLLCEQQCGSGHDDGGSNARQSSGSTPPAGTPGSGAAASILTPLGPRAIVACIPLEDGRLLTAQDAEVSLWDEVPQEAFLNAPVFRVDRSFVYTVSEAVNMPGVLVAAPTAGGGSAAATGASSGGSAGESGGVTGRGTKQRAPIRCALSLPHAKGTSRGLLLTGHDDRSIQVLDLSSFTLRTSLYGHFNAVTCLLEINDLRVASGSTDSNIKIWSGIDAGAATGSKCDLTLRGHSGPIISLSPTWHPHQLMSTSTDGTLRVWNTLTGTCELVWSLGSTGTEVSCLSLLPVSAASREVEMAESDSEMQAIADIISSEGSSYTMPQLPPGAFAHLGLKAHEQQTESERARRRASLAAAVDGSAGAAAAPAEKERPIVASALLDAPSPARAPVSTRSPARRHSLTLSPAGAYSSLGSSVFASQPTPPAVAGLSPRMMARDALIRQHASPAAQLVAPPVADAADDPASEAQAPWLVSAPADNDDRAASTAAPPLRSKNVTPSPRSVGWEDGAAEEDSYASGMPPVSAGTSRGVSPNRAARVFDRSSAVERAAFTDRSDFGERDDSPSRSSRIPPALLAASHVDYSALEIPVPGDAVRQGPLPKAAPLISELSSFSPVQLTHIIHEQHRREHLQRVTINKRVSSLLEPRRIFKRYGAITDEIDRKAERIVNDHVFANRGALNTQSASAAIAAALASGAHPMSHHAGSEEEKQQQLSLARQVAQARLSKSPAAGGHLSDAMLFKGGADASGVSIPRASKTASFLAPHVQQAWELRELLPKPGSTASPEERRANRHVIAQMVARIGSPPRRSKEAEKVHQRVIQSRGRGAAANTTDLANSHVIHSPSAPASRAQTSPGRDRSPKSLARHSAGGSSSAFESSFFVTQMTEADRKQISEGGTELRKSQSHSTLGRSPFAPPPPPPVLAAASSAPAHVLHNGRLGLGSSASASTLGSLKSHPSSSSFSSADRCYVLGGVKLAEPPAQFNRALYGHLLHASPNPRGGLQFNHRAHYGRLEVYQHRDKKIRVAKHGVTGVAATRMARTQDLPQPINADFLARMAYDEQIRLKGMRQSHSPSPTQSQPHSPMPPASPEGRSRPLTGHGHAQQQQQTEFDREKIAATAAAAAAAAKEALMQRARDKAERHDRRERAPNKASNNVDANLSSSCACSLLVSS